MMPRPDSAWGLGSRVPHNVSVAVFHVPTLNLDLSSAHATEWSAGRTEVRKLFGWRTSETPQCGARGCAGHHNAVWQQSSKRSERFAAGSAPKLFRAPLVSQNCTAQPRSFDSALLVALSEVETSFPYCCSVVLGLF